MPSYDRALCAPRGWLDSWPDIGHVAVGMHRQGFDLQLTQYDERGWRAGFYTTGWSTRPERDGREQHAEHGDSDHDGREGLR